MGNGKAMTTEQKKLVEELEDSYRNGTIIFLVVLGQQMEIVVQDHNKESGNAKLRCVQTEEVGEYGYDALTLVEDDQTTIA